IVALLRELHRSMGLTVVIVTHDPELAEHADRCVRLRDGVVEDDRRTTALTTSTTGPVPKAARSNPVLVLAMAVGSAFRSIGRTKLRSALTLLGVMFGIAAVVVTSALGEGAKQRLEKEMTAMGTNMLTVMAGPPPDPTAARVRFDDDDVIALRESLQGALYVAPTNSGTVTVVKDNKSISTRSTGMTLDYLDARNWPVAEGAAWGVDDEERAAKVCLLGKTVADTLFPNGGAVGQTVRVGRLPCEVTGVLSTKGQTGFGQDQDDTVMMPLKTMRMRLQGKGGKYVDSISIVAVDDSQLSDVQARATSLLLERKKAKSDDAIRVRNMAEMLAALDAQRQAITMLLLAVATVSLLVGGIGVMNIMLVSVTERTREIGMRLAIGARRADIRLQFLVESVALTIVGGLIGLGMGWLSSLLLRMFTDYNAVVQPDSAVFAFIISGVIGVVFGLLPAERAARLTPSAALRHE
ncbi:MAG TPA: ABC transporter permease, partial [Myxococcota bacterium]